MRRPVEYSLIRCRQCSACEPYEHENIGGNRRAELHQAQLFALAGHWHRCAGAHLGADRAPAGRRVDARGRPPPFIDRGVTVPILAGLPQGDAPIIVLAGSGTPARVFTAADVVQGVYNCFTLVANGLSANPTFPGSWTQQGSGSYSNVAGTLNLITVGNDLWNDYYTLGSDSTGANYPVPTSFIGSTGTQTLTLTFGGAALSTAALPSGAWFSIAGSRPGSAGLSSPLPYALPTVASLTSTSVVLKLTGSGVSRRRPRDVVVHTVAAGQPAPGCELPALQGSGFHGDGHGSVNATNMIDHCVTRTCSPYSQSPPRIWRGS